jgi:hypothetical protein
MVSAAHKNRWIGECFRSTLVVDPHSATSIRPTPLHLHDGWITDASTRRSIRTHLQESITHATDGLLRNRIRRTHIIDLETIRLA